MNQLFNPKNIAIIGASRHKEKLGYQITDNILSNGYGGKVFPVNPEASTILSLKTYPKVTEIPEEIDLAIVVVPASLVPEVLSDCTKKQVKYAIVISSGFSELGEQGKILQDEIKDVIIKASSLRVLGPNCLGMFNTNIKLNATFAAPKLNPGGVSAVFQSGALGVALLDWSLKYNFGFSKFVSLGNKVDIEESEIINYLKDDPDTKVIALYLENIANKTKFYDTCRAASKVKPIVILKGGTTELGSRAAFSHTAAMVGSNEINKAIFKQSNLIVAKTIEEMLNLIQLLSSEPPMNGANIGIVTNAGGPGILATDMADHLGLSLPLTQEKKVNSLKKFLLPIASLNNPFDISGEASANHYEKVLDYLVSSNEYNAVLALLTPQTSTEVEKTAEVIAEFANSPKPVVASFLGDKAVEKGIDILRQAKVPHFEDPELAVYALYKAHRYFEKKNKNELTIQLEKNSVNYLSTDALELVQQYNIPIPPSGIATTIDVAMKVVGRIGFPVAIKNISSKFIHKFRAGKVILNVQNETYFKNAVGKIGLPVLIQRMVDYPLEVFVGAKRDSELGVLLSFGWGGVFVEDIADISTKVLPLTETDLDEMIYETKIGKVLQKEKVNTSILKNIIIEVGQIMTDHPEISEMDLNPIKVSGNDAVCVDARYKINSNKQKA